MQFDGLVTQIADFQERSTRRRSGSLLLVCRGIDAAGKDGTVKHVLRLAHNPSGCARVLVRLPTSEEARTTSSGATTTRRRPTA
jgi:polyphosphate kinase 2 (PPK2 family)